MNKRHLELQNVTETSAAQDADKAPGHHGDIDELIARFERDLSRITDRPESSGAAASKTTH